MTNLTTSWKKSTRSASENCVEARLTETGDVQVRDSKDRSGPVLTFTPAEWDAFINATKDGDFNL
jgi:hypothetical protein